MRLSEAPPCGPCNQPAHPAHRLTATNSTARHSACAPLPAHAPNAAASQSCVRCWARATEIQALAPEEQLLDTPGRHPEEGGEVAREETCAVCVSAGAFFVARLPAAPFQRPFSPL